MTIKVAINGFGRIGRCVFRAAFEEKKYSDIEIVAINASADLETLRHILKYDSIHGKFSKKVEIQENSLIVDGKKIRVVSERNPEKLPWKEMGIDLVFECTGAFTKKEDASKHLVSGAKKVVISAPSKSDDVKTVIYQVNDNILSKNDDVISIGSCTTNCLAPVVKVLDDNFEIEQGFMTTIHAYTNDQNIVDNPHRDLRRARACAMSMIPTSTGAAKAIGLVLPQLKGKLDGGAIRVPTANVSLVDLTFIAKKEITASQINDAIKKASQNEMREVLHYETEPLVSIDFNHNNFSSCFDANLTKANGKLAKIFSWYDNEWAFSYRMIDVAKLMF